MRQQHLYRLHAREKPVRVPANSCSFRGQRAVRMAASSASVRAKLRTIDGARLSLEDTLKAVAIPPVVYNKCPRVEHFLAEFTGRANIVVAEALNLPESFIDELIRFGAVHSCPVIPDTAPVVAGLPPTYQQELQQIRAEAVERVGRHPSHRQPRRVTHGDLIYQNAYCRVHVHPKRFPAYYAQDWDQRIVMENDHCIVVDKPRGCQVPPRVDNELECLVNWIQRLRDLPSALKPVHRLDTGTEGLVVLAKTKDFARYFQRLLLGQNGRVEKGYRALTHLPPPIGDMCHFVEENLHIKGQPRRSRICNDATNGAAYAELRIVQTQHVTLSEAARAAWCVDSAYESLIELKTGRTHQIRVQLAHEGYPLLGDGLYAAERISSKDAETCYSSRDECLGLQASTLKLFSSDLDTFFPMKSIEWKAQAPWWRADNAV